MKEITIQIKFKYCYSHIKDINILDSVEKTKFITKQLATLIEIYSKENAYRYIEGNKQADKLADEIYNIPTQKTPTISKYYNKFVLKSTRKNNTVKKKIDTIINTQVRKTVKKIIKYDYNEEVWKKNKYNIIKKYEKTQTS